jgi:hypothetical protein
LIFAYFAAFLGRLSPHCQPLFYFIICFLFFWEKNEFWGITQNWVMTGVIVSQFIVSSIAKGDKE